ncbi:hypothetical protein [Pyrobaculum aerophilum]|nr:hypothetical protein [Pyrobaculum aerophilum]
MYTWPRSPPSGLFAVKWTPSTKPASLSAFTAALKAAGETGR